MNKAYLLIGANLGNRMENLKKAIDLIKEKCGTIAKISSIYETQAWGKTDQPSFLNQAVELDTLLNARQLMRCVLKLEQVMGRVRIEKYGPRIIDIDILLFNNDTHDYPLLNLPHPEMQKRKFVLLPLAEIAADAMHPILKRTIAQMLKECPDPLEVKKFT